jgi:TonB-linked SusC/RagA family outer membrane protein
MKKRRVYFHVVMMLVAFQGFSIAVYAQASRGTQGATTTITGVVTDDTGVPLPGATIAIKGTSTGTSTGTEGEFSISVPDANTAVLRVSFIGFKSLEVSINGRRILPPIRLLADVTAVEEVIVTGYQTLSRERATGSFGLITSRKLETQLQPDVKSMLEGQVPGLVLDRDGKIEIRGVSSFSAVKTPLLVIDGYPVDATMNDTYFSYRDGVFENINANNIESITVLKDAVAASIYGSRAANGVIVITTRKGIEGDPKISYRGVYSVIPTPDLRNLHKASASDYIDAEIDLFAESSSTNLNASATEATYVLIQRAAGVITEAEKDARLDELRKRDFVKEAEEYLFRPKIAHQHNVSINGGTKTHAYNVVFNYLGTRENYIHSSSKRAVLDLRDEWKVNRFLTLGANVNVTYSGSKAPWNDASNLLKGGTVSLFNFNGTTSSYTPYSRIVDANGKPADFWIPGWQYMQQLYEDIPGAKSLEYKLLDELARERVETTDFQSRLTGFLRARIIEGLTVEVGGNWQRGNFNWRQTSDENSYTARTAYTATTSIANPANHYIPEGAIVDERRNINESWTFRSQVNYGRDFEEGRHRVNFIAGNEIRRSTYDNNTYATRVGYNPTAGTFVPVNIPAISQYTYADDWYLYPNVSLTSGAYGRVDNRFVSWYGNGSYEYADRYIVSGSIRMDLTNFFGTSKKYRYRPLWSLGGTWKLSEESFFDLPGVNRLYARFSYGINGNIALNQGPFLILGVGSYNATTGGISYSVSSPPNDELRWEKTQTTNVGVDANLLDNRLKVSIDYYNRYSTDLLAADAVDPTTGYTNVTKNVGTISNNGLEISIGADVIRDADFTWNVMHIFTYNYNKVRTFNATRAYPTNYTSGAIHVTGYPADGFWGGRYAGLDANGAVQAYQKDGTMVPIGNLTTDDMVFLGTFRPKFDLSLTNSFRYKDWELSAMIIAKLGHKFRKDAFTGSNIQNWHVADRWKTAGDEATKIYPKLTSWNMDMFYFPYTDVNIGNASFAKLRDVTLSYTFNKALLDRIGFAGSARVYLQARNLLTIKAKGVDIDPESFEYNLTGATGAYTDQGFTSLPFPREFYLGLQISL